MRAESAVEPTKSENITVTWRRSAVSCGATAEMFCVGELCGATLRHASFRLIARSNLTAMTKRHPDFFRGLGLSDQAGRRN